MSRARFGAMALALLLLFGIVPLSVGYLILREWTAERTALVVCGALFLISGATMLLSALWVLVSLGRQRLPLWTGGTATILSAIVLLGATFTDVLPCPGPT